MTTVTNIADRLADIRRDQDYAAYYILGYVKAAIRDGAISTEEVPSLLAKIEEFDRLGAEAAALSRIG